MLENVEKVSGTIPHNLNFDEACPGSIHPSSPIAHTARDNKRGNNIVHYSKSLYETSFFLVG